MLSKFISFQLRAQQDLQSCQPLSTVDNFNLGEFIKSRWYVHQQAPTKYVPEERNYCSYAEYALKDKPSSPWGYTVKVNNYAEDKDGNAYGGELCAYQTNPDNVHELGKLAVAPCWLPSLAAGSYWVLAYEEEEGYALISGGQPTVQTENGCRFKDGIFESGLWIFLRSRERNEKSIFKARHVAKQMGFDLGVLNDVDQKNCERNNNNKFGENNFAIVAE